MFQPSVQTGCGEVMLRSNLCRAGYNAGGHACHSLDLKVWLTICKPCCSTKHQEYSRRDDKGRAVPCGPCASQGPPPSACPWSPSTGPPGIAHPCTGCWSATGSLPGQCAPASPLALLPWPCLQIQCMKLNKLVMLVLCCIFPADHLHRQPKCIAHVMHQGQKFSCSIWN